MKKFRLYFNKDKETAWLNEMAAQGYALTSFFAGVYTFDACTPGQYTYQIDFSDKLWNVSNDYREFMRENNIEIVQIWGPWVILRKLTSDGPFELYSDIDSSIEHYTKIRDTFNGLSIVMVICFIIECIACVMASPIFILFAILIGIFMIAIMRTAYKTNCLIAELKEQKGEAIVPPSNPAPALIAGLLLNCGCCALRISEVGDYICIPIQILAIALMVYGIIKTVSQNKI